MELLVFLKISNPIILVGSIFICLGFLLSFFNLRAIIRAKSSENWDKTTGTITSSKLITLNKDNVSSASTYKPKVEYRYQINNKIYHSKRVYFGSSIISSIKKSLSK